MDNLNSAAKNHSDALEYTIEYIRNAGFSIVDLRENKVGPKSLYEELIRRLNSADVYEPMHLKMSEIQEMLAPHPNQTFTYEEDNETTSISMSNENMVVISLPDGRSINLSGEDTVSSIMTHVIHAGGDLDKTITTTLIAVRALHSLVVLERR